MIESTAIKPSFLFENAMDSWKKFAIPPQTELRTQIVLFDIFNIELLNNN